MASTAGSRSLSSWTVLGALVLGAVFAPPSGCANDPGKISGHSAEGRDALTRLLTDAWPEVVAPSLAEARSATEVMVAATEAWAQAVESGGNTTPSQADAQDAWAEAMEAWQRIELMQIGPAGPSLSTVGGQDRRDEIYSWPTTNPCRVDQETVAASWEDADFFEANLVNVMGFDAIETLLFSPSDDNACPPQVPPNSDDSFEALGADGVDLYRARYATRLGQHILENIDAIESGWTEGFATDLAQAGASGSSFASQEEGLNAIFDALFYLELHTKDRKLAWPLGLTGCGLDDCTGLGETPQAGRSHTWVAANLAGFRALYTGGEGGGMDDLMVAVGQTQIHLDILDALDAAEARAQAMDLPLEEALAVDPDGLQELHDKVKAVTDVLKNDLATLMMLEIPSEAAGDND